jgi:hypothetical protein
MIPEGEARRIYREDPIWRPEEYEWKRKGEIKYNAVRGGKD